MWGCRELDCAGGGERAESEGVDGNDGVDNAGDSGAEACEIFGGALGACDEVFEADGELISVSVSGGLRGGGRRSKTGTRVLNCGPAYSSPTLRTPTSSGHYPSLSRWLLSQ